MLADTRPPRQQDFDEIQRCIWRSHSVGRAVVARGSATVEIDRDPNVCNSASETSLHLGLLSR